MPRSWRVGIAAVALAAWSFERVEVQGLSMAPTYAPGDRLLLVRRYRAPRVGDLVALRDPRGGRRLVKRVAAVEGAMVRVAGDNWASSTDSRQFGPLPRAQLSHLVVRRYFKAPTP